MRYKIKQVEKGVFLVTFKSAYDLAMTFLRYQEFYESPKYRGKFFKIFDYMEWYAANAGQGAFSYPEDYVGFNIPSSIVRRVLNTLQAEKYEAMTRYDYTMQSIHEEIIHKYGLLNEPYYLIGTSKEKADQSTIDHEIAHGLYTTNPAYRKAANALTASLPVRLHTKLNKFLASHEYHKSVWKDELNAFMSTGLNEPIHYPDRRRWQRRYKALFKSFR